MNSMRGTTCRMHVVGAGQQSVSGVCITTGKHKTHHNRTHKTHGLFQIHMRTLVTDPLESGPRHLMHPPTGPHTPNAPPICTLTIHAHLGDGPVGALYARHEGHTLKV
jgi:hypothetical protein